MPCRLEIRFLQLAVAAKFAVVLAVALFPAAGAFAQGEPWRESDEERRQRLKTLDAAEKEQLDRKVERFAGLDSTEQDRLRKIHKDLSHATDGKELFGVLQRYCEWLKTLDAPQRAELAALPAEERISRIRQFMKQQEEQRFYRLANLKYEEGKAVLDWLDEMVKPHEEELLSLLSEDARRAVHHFDDSRMRRKATVWWMYREGKKEQLRERIQPSEEDLKRLLAQLSPNTQEEFRKLGDLQKQQDLVRAWIFFSVLRPPSYRPASDSELHAFFAGLPSDEQARLERLPREEMQSELRKLYYASRSRGPEWGREGGPRPFRGPFRDGGRHDRSRSEDQQSFAKPPGG